MSIDAFLFLTSAEGLDNLRDIDGDAYFDCLLSLDDFKSLKTVSGKVALGMESVSDLLDADRKEVVGDNRNLGLR